MPQRVRRQFWNLFNRVYCTLLDYANRNVDGEVESGWKKLHGNLPGSTCEKWRDHQQHNGRIDSLRKKISVFLLHGLRFDLICNAEKYTLSFLVAASCAALFSEVGERMARAISRSDKLIFKALAPVTAKEGFLLLSPLPPPGKIWLMNRSGCRQVLHSHQPMWPTLSVHRGRHSSMA